LRYRYELTDKGAELLPVLLSLMRWGDKWTAEPEGPPVTIVHRRCGQPTEPIMVCSACKGPVHAGEVSGRTGPGARRGPGAYLLSGWLTAPGRPAVRETAPPPRITSVGRFPNG